LNPDEEGWDALKNERMADFCPQSLEEKETTVTDEMRRHQRRPSYVMAALLQIELPVDNPEDVVRPVGLG
jgi:hypothetical protein